SDAAWRLLRAALDDREAFATWFASRMSEGRQSDELVPPRRIPPLPSQARYRLRPAARMVWRATDSGLQVHCAGESLGLADSSALRTLLQALATVNGTASAAAFRRNPACRE